MMHGHLIPDRGYKKLSGTKKLLTLENESMQDVMAEWKAKARQHQRALKRATEGMRYDPVTKIYY